MYLLYRVQAGRVEDSLLHHADEAEARGEFDLTVTYLHRYLRHRPGAVDILVRYGLLLLDRVGTPDARARALPILDQALQRQPLRDDLRKRVARLALETGQYKTAAWHLDHLVKLHKNDGELEAMLGRCEAAVKHYALAASWLDKAIGHAPAQLEAYTELALLLEEQLGEPRRAREVMDSLVAANGTSFRALLARARFHQRFGTREDAWADLARAKAFAPTAYDVVVTEAELALAQGKPEHARRCLQSCLSREPQRANLYLLLAAAEQQARRRPEALACLRKGLKVVAGPERDALRLTLAHLLAHEGRLAEAAMTLDSLRGTVQPAAAGPARGPHPRPGGRGKPLWWCCGVPARRLAPSRDATLARLLLQAAEEPSDYHPLLWLSQGLWSADGPGPEVEATLRRAAIVGDAAPRCGRGGWCSISSPPGRRSRPRR